MSREVADKLCKKLYNTLKEYNVYPALTGGTLYKRGKRKDIDIILYKGDNGGILELTEKVYAKIPMSKPVKVLMGLLEDAGLSDFNNYGRVVKCKYDGYDIDIIFPEAEQGTYGQEEQPQ